MNWKRGILRLWVIISLLWLLAATGASFLVSSKLEERTSQPTAAEIAECEEIVPKTFVCFGEVEVVRVWQLPPWPQLAGVASVPILLLILGAAGYWVAKGFKASN